MATYRKQTNQSFSKVLLLVSCLLLSNITKAYDFKVDDIYYNKISETEVEVTYNYLSPITPIAYTGDVVIPSVVTYSGEIYKVTGIGEQAFYNCGDKVKSVTMPSSILKIGQGAFSSLWNITYIEIPKSVVVKGEYNQEIKGETNVEIIPVIA